MTMALAPLAPRPAGITPRAPGYGRAFGRVVVSGYLGKGYEGGRQVPLAGAAVRAYVPGTSTPWPDPLYLDEAATTPAVFPVATDESGAVALWAEAQGRLELECDAPGYLPQRVPLDLEPPPGTMLVPPEYLTEDEADAAYAPLDHLHPSTTTFFYRFSANTAMADPGAGSYRVNAATFSAATQLALDTTTDGGVDVSNALAALREGDALYLQTEASSANWARYTLSAEPTANAGWYLLPVTTVEAGGTIPTNNTRCLLEFVLGGERGLDQATADALYVNVAGDTMTGDLTVDTFVRMGSSPGQLLYTDVALYRPSAGRLRVSGHLQSDAEFTAYLAVSAAGATERPVRWQTNGVDRWVLRANPTAETGSNAGSDLELRRYSDAAADLGTALSITRATGAATFGVGGGLTISNNGGHPQISTGGGSYLYLGAAAGYVLPEHAGTYLGTPGVPWYIGCFGAGGVDIQGKAVAASPDAGNALEWRANGFYTTPKVTVAATAPASPATGDLWVW